MPVQIASRRLLLSGNEAVARTVWESGCKAAAAYPGTPSTEMLEVIATYPEIYSEWSVNEKSRWKSPSAPPSPARAHSAR
jgi:indolepyruvate ferredoxin oxidoreductase alpha subunit